MQEEDGFYRFFAYLNLFMFSMLTLILGSNYLMMFIGWEGVGLCSYLLIGYYFLKKSAGDAAKKAFVVNRVGDWGLVDRHHADLRRRSASLEFTTVGEAIREGAAARAVSRRAIRSLSASRWRCSSAPPESRRRFRSMSGCRTPWKVRRPSAH